MNEEVELSAFNEFRKYAIIDISSLRNSEYETHQPDDDERVITDALVSQLGGAHTASKIGDLYTL